MIAEQDVDRMLLTLKIIWMAMLFSLAIYLVAGRLGAPDFSSPLSAEAFGTLRTVLYALGLVTLIAAGYVRRLILAAVRSAAAPNQAGQSSVLPKYSIAVIASLAMCESIGIYGLVLFLLGKDAMDLYLLVGISAAAMFYYRPKKDELLNLCQSGS